MPHCLKPLTPNQEAIWFEQQLYPGTPLYNIGGYLVLAGSIDPTRLNQGIDTVIRQNDALRIKIHENGGRPVQEFLSPFTYHLETKDFSGAKDPHQTGLDWMRDQFTSPIDTGNPPLFQLALLKIQAQRYYFFLKWHHIIIDGWGISLFCRYLAEAYNGLPRNQNPSVTSGSESYGDYAGQELAYIGSERFEADKAFWKQKYPAIPPPLLMPQAKAVVEDTAAVMPNHRKTIILGGEFYHRLAALTNLRRTTIFHVFIGIVYTYFSRIYGTEDMVIGLSLLNRRDKKQKRTIGLFTGVSPLRIDFKHDKPLRELLRVIAVELKQCYRHQRFPLAEIGKSSSGFPFGRRRLYDIAVAYLKEDYHLQFDGHDVIPLVSLTNESQPTPFALEICEFSGDQDVRLNIDYHLAYFSGDDIAGMCGHLDVMLHHIFDSIDTPLKEIEILTPAEKHRLLVEFNDTAAAYPAGKTIPGLFAAQVQRTPHHTALVGGTSSAPGADLSAGGGVGDTCTQSMGGHLTYRELNERSNRLAYGLRENGVQPDTVVGLMAARSLEMIIGILGILKAGGAYLPIDPEYPEERKQYMLKDSGAKILLTQQEVAGLSSPEAFNNSPKGTINHLHLSPSPVTFLAYIIYTSGTTGRPKGVMIDHGNVVRLLFNDRFPFDFSVNDTWTLFHSYCFDFSVWEIYGALLYGGKLLVIPRWGAKDTGWFLEVLAVERVTVLNQTPSAFYNLVRLELRHPAKTLHLRYVIFGGEALMPARLKEWQARYRDTRLINMYGITETTVHATYKEITPREIEENARSIGKPIPTLRAYILDRYEKLLPLGAAGELCIAGAGVSRGYLNRPELTFEKFCLRRPGGRFLKKLPPWTPRKNFLYETFLEGPGNLFSKRFPGRRRQRLYKTGDLARWLPEGDIEYLGRIDQQIKIRGFRIEPGEIETQLMAHGGITRAVVCAREGKGGDTYLCAYIARDPGTEVGAAELRDYLTARLPDYMIPSFFTAVDRVPLTPSGKVDLAALPGPEAGAGNDYTAPGNETQEKLVEIWAGVLHLEKEQIGIDTNFFELGGNSLTLAAVTQRVKEVFHGEVPFALLFRYPTVRWLSGFLGPGPGNNGQKGTNKKFCGVQGPPRRGEPIISAFDSEDVLHSPTCACNLHLPPLIEKHVPGRRRQWKLTGKEVAVIGMAGRFPGAATIDEFWENLKNGLEAITFFCDEELREAGVSRQSLENPGYIKAKGVLPGVDRFDAAFFDYLPADAVEMDPQTRVFHQCVWSALENAGYDPGVFPGLIGLYAGSSSSVYWETSRPRSGVEGGAAGRFSAALLRSRDFLTTSVSYKLNLRGPALFIQTACSTSLAAIHTAYRAVLNGECDMALAGAVCVTLPSRQGYLYQEGMIGAPDGHCRTFDAEAKGTVPGDGAGVVVLKGLTPARRDGDHIYAVIKGSAVNNDGLRKVGFTAPGVEGQAMAIKAAREMARVEPDSISCIEAHGTGTALGDPTEIAALKLAFDTQTQGYCAIGSVKSNLGHLDTAAGVAGFIKIVLALHHRVIPPSLHFNRPNPKIDFNGSPFYVNITLRKWENTGYPLRAGVSSFGIGGTNAHVVLEEWPVEPSVERQAQGAGRKYHLVLLSARTGPALERARQNLAGYFRNNPGINLADVAYTLQMGRRAFAHRRMAVVSSAAEATEALSSPGPVGKAAGASRAENPPVVFMFPGQGSQYVNMGKELYQSEPRFRETMDRCFEILKTLLDYDIKEILYPPEDHSRSNRSSISIQRTEIAQPVLFIFEYALAQLLITWGIKPSAMIGHSIGEYAAAVLAGVVSLEDALRIVVLRGRFMQAMPPGAMLEVSLSEDRLTPFLTAEFPGAGNTVDSRKFCSNKKFCGGPGGGFSKEPPGRRRLKSTVLPGAGPLALAAVNSPCRCVVSGPGPDVARLQATLTGSGHECRLLHTSHAFHSPMMDPILTDFAEAVGRVTLTPPGIPYISNVSGEWLKDREAVGPAYWARQLRGTVRFSRGLQELFKRKQALFLEVGPGKVLCGFVKQHAPSAPRVAINLVRHPKETADDAHYLWTNLGRLWLHGGVIDWDTVYQGEKRQRLPLPTYSFDAHFYPVNGAPPASPAKPEPDIPPRPPRALPVEPGEPGETGQILTRIWRETFGIPHVPPSADFFELGGDSLKVMVAAAKIHEHLDVKVTLEDFFSTPTIRGLARYIESKKNPLPEDKYAPIEPVEKKEYHVLSSAQKRIYILQQVQPGGIAYNSTVLGRLEGEADRESLETAFKKMICRHESLRTSFETVDDRPVQRIHDRADFKIEGAVPPACNDRGEDRPLTLTQNTDTIIKDFLRPFDLAEAPLLRALLVETGGQSPLLVLDSHHIIFDGISGALFLNEFLTLYDGGELPPLRIRCKDYSHWQQQRRETPAMKRQEVFWHREFSREIPRLDLPLDYPRPPVQDFAGASIHFRVGPGETRALRDLARQEEVTLFMLLLALDTVFLAKISGQEDIVVGTPIAGRRHRDLDRVIGMFVDTLPLRNYPCGDKSFQTFLKEIKANTLAAFENQEYPLEDLVETVVVQRDSSGNSLFDTLLALQTPAPEGRQHTCLRLETREYNSGTAKFALTFQAVAAETTLDFMVEYGTKLFKEETVHRFITYFRNIISGVVDFPGAALAGLEILPLEEKHRLLYEFNNTSAAYPVDKTLQRMVAEQVERTPDHTALVGKTSVAGVGHLTYKELNEHAGRWSYLLVEKGVQADTIVGLMAERSLEALIGILAVLKAGGAYLPIDPEYPAERIDYMLSDSGTTLLATTRGLATGIKFAKEIISLADAIDRVPTAPCPHLPPVPATCLAYVIYTSGSTGKPRGVMIQHRSVVNLVFPRGKSFDIDSHDRVLQFSSLCFDASVEQIFSAFFLGAGLVLIDKDTLMDAGGFEKFMLRHSITYIDAVPSFLTHMNLENCNALKNIISGGEECPVPLAERLSRRCNFFNAYGPTEATVTAVVLKFTGGASTLTRLPLGKPVANTVLYLFDRWLNPVPLGTAGELYLGGAGLARGYLNQPELTFERFCLRRVRGADTLLGGLFSRKLPPWTPRKSFLYEKFLEGPGNLFSKRFPGRRRQKLYKTGDLARWLADGSIEFLGRGDFQVKIRGYRIELGEIERRLSEHKAVKEAVVKSCEVNPGDKYLCAYIVSANPLELPGLRDHLAAVLPGYMIPSRFIRLDKLPLTPSGKVARKLLPEPGLDTAGPVGVYIPPRDEIEEQLAEIWAQVLGREKETIGRETDFFQAGGHSLRATILMAKIHKAFNVQLPLAIIFKTPFLGDMAQHLRAAGLPGTRTLYRSIAPTEKKEYYPLSPAQERFYMLQQVDPAGTAYHMSGIFLLEGKLEVGKLERVFQQLLARHESLRTSFHIAAGGLVQRINAQVAFAIQGLAPPAGNAGTVINEFIRPFDLAQAPLLRVGLVKNRGAENLYTWMVDLHHIVSDGISIDILVREFMALYREETLPALRVQYRDFVCWQKVQRAKGKMEIHQRYWLERFSGPLPVLRLPTDYPRPRTRTTAGTRLEFKAGPGLRRDIDARCRETGTTLYMFLLAVYTLLLSKYSGQEDIIVGSPAANRNHADLENMIGLVMGSLVIRSFPRPAKTFRQFLGEVKENTLEAYAHLDYPFEELLKHLSYDDSPGREPVTGISLILRNLEMSPLEIPGLKLSPYSGPLESLHRAKVDLTLEVEESPGDLIFTLEYRTALFKRQTMARWAEHFLNLLRNVVEEPGQLLSRAALLGKEEKSRLTGGAATYYPLSHPQKRIYYTEKRYAGTSVGTLAFTIRYRQVLDKTLLQQAINRVILENEGLRLRIVEFEFESEPSQYLSPFKPRELETVEFSGPGSRERLEQWIEKETAKPFALIDRDLFYFAYIRCNEEESGYYLKLHHIIADGWAFFLVSARVDELYRALKAGEKPGDTPSPSYLRYIADEQDYLDSSAAEADRVFWHRYLHPLPEAPDLSYKKGNRTRIKSEVSKLIFPDELRTRILGYAALHKTSIYKLVCAALAIYIWKVTGLEDLAIGSANHNRSTESHKKMVGMFVGTLPLRIKTGPDMDFRHFVKRMGEEINPVIKYRQKYPFDLLNIELREKEGIDIDYLLDLSLIGHPDVREDRFKMEHYFHGYDPTPLSIHINSSNKNIHGILELEWNYQEERYSRGDIEHMHRALCHILSAALAQPGKRLSKIEMLTPEEKGQIIHRFNDTGGRGVYPEDKLLHVLFAGQVSRTPDHMALVTGTRSIGGHLTYKELNERSNRLAYRLIEKGVKADIVVGIMAGRSLEQIIAILGVLKSGGAYLPMDPGYPRDRIDYMLADSGANVLLTGSTLAEEGEKVRRWEGKRLCFEEFPEIPGRSSYPLTFLPSYLLSSSHLAYIIYTSGSTGRPRGVGVEHCNVIGYVNAFAAEFSLDEKDTVIQQASYSFDAFVEEMYPILLRGGKLAMAAQDEVLDVNRLAEFIVKQQITLITCTPLLLSQLNQSAAAADKPGGPFPALRTFISGGDVLKREYIDTLARGGRVYNTYGPTETTVCATYYRCPADSPLPPDILIGKPIANYRVFILDRYFCLLPAGAGGELCISGTGVSRGYLNRPELTFEKFLGAAAVEGAPSPGQRLNAHMSYTSSRSYIYKTGDLARWMADGNIQFLGRIDRQVKIRGYRIELGEIESRLLKHEAVEAAVVIDREDRSLLKEKYLCAYFTAGKELESDRLREYLSEELPAYMIPSWFVRLDKIPLTPSGKVDRGSLPEPGPGTAAAYVAPGDEIEEKLAEEWAGVLGIDKTGVSVAGNFFQLGGHSLKAIALLGRIQQRLNTRLALANLFEMPTIRELARYIRGKARSLGAAPEPVEQKEYYPLSSPQQRLYILHKLDKNSTGYNMPMVVVLEGDLDKDRFQDIFFTLITRHESLRTSFELVEAGPVQRVHAEVEFAIEEVTPPAVRAVDASAILRLTGNANTLCRDFTRPFDLSRAPLLRVGLVSADHKSHLLLLDLHHIISDGRSVARFVEEFKSLYAGQRLPALRLQYKDFSGWQNSPGQREAIQKQLDYWQGQFKAEIPVLELPIDFPRPALQSFAGNSAGFETGPGETAALKTVALEQGVTLYMVVLSLYYIFLARISNREDLVVGTPVLGRRHPDLENIIGMFVNTLPLRNRVGAAKTVKQFLVEVKKGVLDAFENQDWPYEDLVEQLGEQVSRDTGRNPLFDTLFALHTLEGRGDEEEIPGLKVISFPYKAETAKFDLSLLVLESEGKLSFTFEYCTTLFKPATIERLSGYFKNLISSVTAHPGTTVSGLEILSAEEKKRLLVDFNATAAVYPADKTLPGLFETQVEQTPDHTALVGRESGAQGTGTRVMGGQLTYRELNERANRLASGLKARGVQPDTIVGLRVERSLEMIIGIFAILKAGAAYLPMDPEYPAERTRYMLADSNAGILLTGGEIAEFSSSQAYSHPSPSGTYHPGNLVYVIYTSGSTGRPKGVVITHRSVINTLFALQNTYPLERSGVYLLKTAYTFDVAAAEIFGWFWRGGKLAILPAGSEKDPQQLLNVIAKEGITHIDFVPSMFQAFVFYLNQDNSRKLNSLKYIFLAGEELLAPAVKRFAEFNSSCSTENLYGPSEAAIYASRYSLSAWDGSSRIPIGKPLDNVRIFILDKEGRPQPPGIPGELCISGAGLARGYLNQPELTAEKFCLRRPGGRFLKKLPPWTPRKNFLYEKFLEVSEPFFKKVLTRRRLYRTGDLARWRVDGNIEFLGREDHQVKIRGFRVETGEIENQLLGHEGIKEAIVRLREDRTGNKELCAYIVPGGFGPKKQPRPQDLRNYLAGKLPGYMIPAYFILLDSIPLTGSGKIDRKSLPEPVLEVDDTFATPENETQEQLMEIWSALMGLEQEKISIDANFFQLGGHSLKAILLLALVHKRFNLEVSLAEMFANPTIRGIAAIIDSVRWLRNPRIDTGRKRKEIEL